MWRYPPGVELFDAAKLIGLEPRGISDYVFYFSMPPIAQCCKIRTKNVVRPNRRAVMNWVWLKLQEERCEQLVSDAGKVLWILLGDFASLIRLSITINWLASVEPLKNNLIT